MKLVPWNQGRQIRRRYRHPGHHQRKISFLCRSVSPGSCTRRICLSARGGGPRCCRCGGAGRHRGRTACLRRSPRRSLRTAHFYTDRSDTQQGGDSTRTQIRCGEWCDLRFFCLYTKLRARVILLCSVGAPSHALDGCLVGALVAHGHHDLLPGGDDNRGRDVKPP